MTDVLNGPSVSVIIPVLHEEERIRECLRHVKEIADGETIEIIVIDADPAGGTINLIRHGEAVKMPSSMGRGAQMNRGAWAAKGAILLFLHADTILPHRAFGALQSAMMDDRCIGGAFDLGIDSDRVLLRLTALCASLKHRMTRVPYGDQAIFLRAEFFREIGGYREIPLFEDVELMRRIKKLGKKIVILRQRTKTSPRAWERRGAVFTIFRNWTLQALYLLGASPEFLVKHYYNEHNRRD